jgi:hypothetical protein
MKELEKQATKTLIEFFELYIEKGLTEEVKSKAKKLYDATPSSALVRESILGFFGSLFPLGYTKSNIKKPTQEEAKEILAKLKKLKEKLEN